MNPAIEKAMNALKFVAQHVKNEDNFNSVSSQEQQVTLCIHIMPAYEFSIIVLNVFISYFQFADDWKYVAMVLDRILLWIFAVACIVGKITC